MILVGVGEARHDSSICAYIDGTVKYRKYERYSGIKHANPPVYWYFDTLREWGIELDKVNSIAFTSNGVLGGFYSTVPPFNGEMFLDDLPESFYGFSPKDKTYLLDHHYSHCLSCSDFTNSSKCISLDGNGSNFNKALLLNSNSTEIIRYNSHKSLGYPLRLLGEKLGLKVEGLVNPTDVIGKVMGLQAYGTSNDIIINAWKNRLPSDQHILVDWLDTLNYTNVDSQDTDFLNLLNSIFELGYVGLKNYFANYDKCDPILYSGGTALNVNWNRWLLDEGYNLKIEPHVYDGGLSIGCLRFLCNLYSVELKLENFPYIQGDEAPKTKPSSETIDKVAELLSQGKIVGWYQGNGELGPRALGNRSILMNPSVKNGKDILNQKVKHREWWRPFGASVKQDKASEYFDLDNSPYMLYTAKVLKDDLPPITHVDGTCRHQTVTPEQNSVFYDLLDAFEDNTGLPVLLNTSLNLGGKPIAGKIEEAIELFKTSEMDALCVGDELYVK